MNKHGYNVLTFILILLIVIISLLIIVPDFIMNNQSIRNKEYNNNEIINDKNKEENEDDKHEIIKLINEPTCNQNIYDGNEKLLIKESKYYNVTNNKQIDIGNYEVIINAKPGYEFNNNKTSIKLMCNIEANPNDIRYTYSLSNTNITNQNVIFNFKNLYKNYISILLPDNKTNSNSNVNYTITKNGNYKFVINYKDKSETINLNITNIDKEKPTGTCNINIANKKSIYSIKAKDNNSISKYLVYGDNKTYTNETFTINNVVTNYNVTIYDKANNTTSIKCTVNKTNNPINKTSSSKILTEYYSDTLRYWVETKDKYHITHIWVKDAIKQVNTWLYNDKGGTITSVKNLANNLISKNNLYKKGLVISNCSAVSTPDFSSYLYDGSAYNKKSISSWKYYPQSPLIISNSKKVKDFTNNVLPSHSKDQTKFDKYTYVFSSDGWLRAYSYTINDVEANKELTTKIMNTNPIFTIGFKPVLVSNYVAKKGDTDSYKEKKKRNSLCQIDENNFILLNTIGTKKDDTKNVASFNEMADYLKNLGCRNAFNLDGGGSTTEYTKKNENVLNKVVVAENVDKGGRYVGDALYFREQ